MTDWAISGKMIDVENGKAWALNGKNKITGERFTKGISGK